MTGLLTSVNSLPEALLALAAQVDIIDLKQPSQGALGALPITEVRQIVQAIGGRCPISATVGDLPMQPEIVCQAVQAMAATGVDYVKIGFFPGGDWLGTLQQLDALNATRTVRLIAVLFADTEADFAVIPLLKNHGFTGVMLDTMDKGNGALTTIMPLSVICQFVNQSQSLGLLCGLAGSLRLADIAGLLLLQADYLGFRGALCVQQQRTARMDKRLLEEIRQALGGGLVV
jgi:uncharacterized protein (UPF0264 family)